MANITLTINTDDAALNHDCNTKFCTILYNSQELRRILTTLGTQAGRDRFNEVGSWKVYDINGNPVGRLEVTK